MRWMWLIACLCVAGCNTPPPEYRGIAGQRITVGQSTFDVRHDGSKALALRVNSEWALRPDVVMPRARVAIEKSTGCRVTQMEGDQVLIEAKLDCGSGPGTVQADLNYDCDYNRLYRGKVEVVCTPGI